MGRPQSKEVVVEENIINNNSQLENKKELDIKLILRTMSGKNMARAKNDPSTFAKPSAYYI